MKKLLGLISGFVLLSSTTTGVVACNNQTNSKADNFIAAYQSALWRISPEHQASVATQFGAAIDKFESIIHDNANENKLAINSNKVINVDKNFNVNYSSQTQGLYVPAVIVDLDETFIDNSINDIYGVLTQQGYNPNNFHTWVKAEKATIYYNVLNFVKKVWSEGGIVLFDSDRNQGDLGGNKTGDELVSTYENLAKYGYPEQFMQSYVWWMMGSMTYEDQDKGQTDQTLNVLKNKESRFNYINTHSLKPRTDKQLGIIKETFNKDTQTTIDAFKNILPNGMKTRIVMKMGDDLNDFNNNLLAASIPNISPLIIREAYIKNQDILNLFGQNNIAIYFKNEDKGVVEYYNSDVELKDIDQNLLNAKIVTAIKQDNTTWKETYFLVSGNASYGHWLSSFQSVYGNNASGMRDALKKYFDDNGGDKIWS